MLVAQAETEAEEGRLGRCRRTVCGAAAEVSGNLLATFISSPSKGTAKQGVSQTVSST